MPTVILPATKLPTVILPDTVNVAVVTLLVAVNVAVVTCPPVIVEQLSDCAVTFVAETVPVCSVTDAYPAVTPAMRLRYVP